MGEVLADGEAGGGNWQCKAAFGAGEGVSGQGSHVSLAGVGTWHGSFQ